MKRKRGRKKRKPGSPLGLNMNESYPVTVTSNTTENSDVDEFSDDEFDDSVMNVDTSSLNGNTQLRDLSSSNPDGLIDQMMGKSVNCMKVKLKKTKVLDSHRSLSNLAIQSNDSDKSSQHGRATEKLDDSDNSLSEGKTVLENPLKKAGNIKIKSLLDQSNNLAAPKVEIPHKKEPIVNFREPQYNKQELDAALEVINKVMKMDAAEPFNVPVNPVALGIPDYFDVIDTPMDFGTIRSNLENGVKYMNSEEVYKDVEYIWDNCSKYNSKGDYIMDLMKRVKKSFMKYWITAGLYSEEARGSEEDNIEPSGLGKPHAKGGYIKQKAQKRGGRHHKHDCLCAICVLVRRRREREEIERLAKTQPGVGNSNLAEDFKLEESSPLNSPYGDDSSSNTEVSHDLCADDERVVKEDVGVHEQQRSLIDKTHKDVELGNGIESLEKDGRESLKVTLHDQSRERINAQTQFRMPDKSGTDVHIVKGTSTLHHIDGSASLQLQNQEDLKKRLQREKVLERLSNQNPTLLSLCGALFPDNPNSVWAGPHSLAGHRGSAQRSSIHDAIETFMK